MRKAKRPKNRNLQAAVGFSGAAIAAALIFLFPGSATQAHIVPPEKLHPVVESYRRMTFLLNLNPVLWENVRADFGVLVRHFDKGDAPSAGKAADEFETILKETGAATSNRHHPVRAGSG